MSVTLKQIAELAGVHKSTVDKVIHNRPGVSDAKRRQIRQLLEEYGYESNPLAKALNYQKKKMTVSVVMPDVDATPLLKQGMELVRQDFNSFNVEVSYHETSYSDAEGQAHILQELCHNGTSGVVLVPIEHPAVAEAMVRLAQANIPVVTVNSDLDAPRLCFVGQDMEQSGQTAVRMFSLFLSGGGKLAVISSHNMRAVRQRERAFIQYIPRCCTGLDVMETLYIQETPDDAYLKTRELMNRQPMLDGLFITCGNVVDICHAARDCNRKLTIICYEKYPSIASLVRSGEIACTLDGALSEQGRLSMRLLFEKLVYDKTPGKKVFYTKNEILLRENLSYAEIR